MNDPLTNLPQKEDLETKLASLRHPKLILIDIDDFNGINFKYSDKGGNTALCTFSYSLKKFAQSNNLEAFHLKADIFVLIADMPFELKRMENLLFLVTEFCTNQSFSYQEEKIRLKFHIGICLDQNGHIKKALKALELSKKEDQPFVTYAQFVLNLLEEDEASTKKSIQTAIDKGKIFPHFQAILQKDMSVLYSEMLLRLELANTIQYPKFFLHVAQKYGQYEQILSFVLKKLPSDYKFLGINISKSDLFEEKIFTILLEHFKNSGAIFEIQIYNAKEPQELAKKLKIIKENGIKICLDNVQNTEDLSPYEHLDIDFVKVYGQTLRLLHVNEKEKTECANLLSLIKKMGAKSIASHINSEKTLNEAKELGFDCFQGFFLAKPTK